MWYSIVFLSLKRNIPRLVNRRFIESYFIQVLYKGFGQEKDLKIYKLVAITQFDMIMK